MQRRHVGRAALRRVKLVLQLSDHGGGGRTEVVFAASMAPIRVWAAWTELRVPTFDGRARPSSGKRRPPRRLCHGANSGARLLWRGAAWQREGGASESLRSRSKGLSAAVPRGARLLVAHPGFAAGYRTADGSARFDRTRAISQERPTSLPRLSARADAAEHDVDSSCECASVSDGVSEHASPACACAAPAALRDDITPPGRSRIH